MQSIAVGGQVFNNDSLSQVIFPGTTATLTGTVLTCVSLYAQTHFLDFQAIMTTGAFLWTNAALLNDWLTATVAFYALGLNVSLDVALMGPFLCYRLVCKAMKQVVKE